MHTFDTSLYLVTDSSYVQEEVFLYRVEQALCGGVTMLQLREKEKNARDYLYLAEKVHALAQAYHVPLLIDDRLDVAMAVDAEGVHLGQTDLPVQAARRIWGKHKIIGATAKTVQSAEEAYAEGADYLGVGAIFPTTTKVKTVLTDTVTLRAICEAVPIAVNAIGGLNAENLSVLSGIPVDGICVVSAIMRSENPKGAAQALKQAFLKMKESERSVLCKQY